MKRNRRLVSKIYLNFDSITDFAEDINVPPPVVSGVVRNRRELSPEQQKLWAKKLNCDPKEIFETAV